MVVGNRVVTDVIFYIVYVIFIKTNNILKREKNILKSCMKTKIGSVVEVIQLNYPLYFSF